MLIAIPLACYNYIYANKSVDDHHLKTGASRWTTGHAHLTLTCMLKFISIIRMLKFTLSYIAETITHMHAHACIHHTE